MSPTGYFSWPYPSPAGAEYYVVFRALDSSGGVDNRVVRYTVTPGGGGGGCPFADTRTASGWQVENSMLSRSLSGSLSLDAYRLKGTPEVVNGRHQLRLRENEQEITTLDQVGLVAVDHAPTLRAYAFGDRLVLGTRVSAVSVTTSAGQSITSLVSGSGPGFVGQLGDTLRVEMTTDPGGTFGAQATLDCPDCPPGVVEGDWKEDPALRYEGADEFRAGAAPALASDQMVLENTGILIQAPDGQGGWRTLRHHYPRQFPDEAAIDSIGSGSLRLVFVGRHRLNFIGRIEPAATTPVPQVLALRRAQHSRLGSALAAVSNAGGSTTLLTPGDTLSLEFSAAAIPQGQVREWFLITRGVYTAAASPAQQQVAGSSLPLRFVLAQNQPNPFSSTTRIAFELPVTSRVTLEVFDLAGRRVAMPADAEYPAGYHSAEWDHRDASGGAVPPGVYLYRISAGGFRDQKKMILLP